MSQAAVQNLLERWSNEPGFREQFLADPHATIVANGITLTPEEEAAVKAMDWSGSDEQLAERISKNFVTVNPGQIGGG